MIARGKELIREGWEAEGSDEVRSRLYVLAAQVEYGERLMGARRTAETWNRTRDPGHLRRLLRERDAVVSHVETTPWTAPTTSASAAGSGATSTTT